MKTKWRYTTVLGTSYSCRDGGEVVCNNPANAALIAAAPAMYEALRTLVDDLSRRGNVSAETLAPARAALAAAEGEA